MCPPGCLHAVCDEAQRNGRLKPGYAVRAGEAGAWPPQRLPIPLEVSSIADLSHALHEGFPTMDGSRWFSAEQVAEYARDGVNLRRWTLMEHTGTHLDAPIHFSADGLTAELIPVGDLIVPAAVIDISERAAENPDTALTPEDVRSWEAKHGPLPEGCCVIMNAGWHRLVDDPRFTGNRDGTYHTPGFHSETAQMLISERNVKGLAVDTLSLDTGLNSAGNFPVHFTWLGSGRWGVEAIANLDAIPEHGAHLFVGAAKVKGATGCPARIVALI